MLRPDDKAEIDAYSDDEVFLHYYGMTLAARREIANGHKPSAEDVRWMRFELYDRAEAEERRRTADAA